MIKCLSTLNDYTVKWFQLLLYNTEIQFNINYLFTQSEVVTSIAI